MKRLRFIRGSVFIQVKIEGRTIEFVTPMLNFVPIRIDLNKLNEQKEKLSRLDMDEDFIKALSRLKTEEELAKDLIKDLTKSGWRYSILKQ